MLTACLLAAPAVAPQAKTTKKIVLRMQCAECKQTCMKGLKVRAAAGTGLRRAAPGSPIRPAGRDIQKQGEVGSDGQLAAGVVWMGGRQVHAPGSTIMQPCRQVLELCWPRNAAC